VACVGRQRVDLAAVLAVECQGVVAAVGDPEVVVEPVLEGGGLLFESLGEGYVVPGQAGQAGGS